ncbi:hypothetical protein Taro_035475 [Colocasia esculenta]|uniref:Uncharacterized protein n=1 Tax=Colocasia esculenta TaxID=4460 RepID=A0A843W5T9_COLES|nr:hypothetical protein [Colocasia esculenta]
MVHVRAYVRDFIDRKEVVNMTKGQIATGGYTEGDDMVSRSRRWALSRSDRDSALCRDGPCEGDLSSRRVHRVCA